MVSISKLAPFLCILMLLSLGAAAVEFSSEIIPIKDKITAEGDAIFIVKITNKESSIQKFRVTPAAVDQISWFIRSNPFSNPILMDILPGKDANVTILISPNVKYVGSEGSHFVNIEVRPESSAEKVILKARVGLTGSDRPTNEYVPTVTKKTDMQGTINPSENLKFSVTLTNQNKLNMDNVKLRISSKLVNIEQEFDLGPDESKVIPIEKELNPKTPPFADSISIIAEYNGKNLGEPLVIKYEVIPYGKIDSVKSTRSTFLGKVTDVIFTNKGNVEKEEKLMLEAPFLSRIFGSSKPDANVEKIGGKSYYVWVANISPFGSFRASASENYSVLLIIIVAAGIIFAIIRMRKNPLALTKSVKETESNEGGISRIKLVITVKNKSGEKLREIKVIDKLPKLLSMEKDATIGSLRPAQVSKGKGNNEIIVWKIEELAPGEERVITYYLASSLKIVGGLTLQPAMAKFTIGNREYKPKSNTASVKG